ncbi:MAG TPA: copper-binding protein [Morganella sp. (in: Bacteria)]|nr:copper-binding protein [Morganella sp. (in: enterobacteria)]
MKKVITTAALMMVFSGAATAATQNTPRFSQMNEHEKAVVAHDMMNNGRSGAHQVISNDHKNKAPAEQKATENTTTGFSQMNEHEQAAVAHDMMNNGRAGQHQVISNKHNQLAGNKTDTAANNSIATPFSQMSQQERAAVSRDMMNNGRSGPHQLLAEQHRRQS